MSETKPKKMVSRSVAMALGIICILLIAVIAYFSITGISAQNSYTNLQNQNNQLQTWLAGNETLLNQTQADNTNLQNQYNGLNATYNSYVSTHSKTNVLQNYTAVYDCTVLDVSRMVNGTQHGLYSISVGMPFGFSPKKGFIAVTNAVFSVQAYVEGTGGMLMFYSYSLDLNGVTFVQDQFQFMDYNPAFRTGFIPNATNLIHPGINGLHIQLEQPVYLLKVDLQIEYTYQA